MPELLTDWVTLQAQRRPEAVAVVGDDETLTYSELEGLSNQLARILKERGCETGDRVCLLMPKRAAAIVSLLGIYKADCIYVPLDPASPAARLAKLVRACESRWILAAGPVAGLLEELFEGNRLSSSTSVGWMEPWPPRPEGYRIEFSRLALRKYSKAPPHQRTTRQDPAHILFTSGSTGAPKGVVITHANVIGFVEWARSYFEIGPSDRLSGHPPLHFDLSVFDIFATFAAGAQLHLVPPALNVDARGLAEFIRTSRLTQWFSVPSTLSYLARFDVVRQDDFPDLKRVLWCGEVLPTPTLIYWMKRLPHVKFTNLYGPTEATIASSYYTVPRCPQDERETIPIGTACEGEELLVLDGKLRPVPRGEVGDLYIRGVGLSPGYWKNADKTRAVFLPGALSADPAHRLYKTGDLARVGPDGLVYFLGRADMQIKSRGYRIELGEIETALNALPSVQECTVVVIRTDAFENTIICCAYVPAPGAEVTPVALRRELSRILPTYMLPARWEARQDLPRTANGKLDRRRIREGFEHHEAQTARPA